MKARFEPITGRYLHLDLLGQPHRLYVEEADQGIPLLCLRFRALIGLESAAHTDPYYDLSWLNRPDVHGGMVCARVVSGLVAPTAPPPERWKTLWHYMQGGPGPARPLSS